MSTEPDTSGFQDVLRRAGAGDEQAWQQVVDAYGSRVYALLFSRCRNAELAEELTQSTFCTVVTKLSAYDEQGKFEPWLFRIAMNRLRDEMRRRGRHAVNVANDTLSTMETTPRFESTPEAGGEQQMELSRALREAVASLQESDQEILHLRHVSGLSFKQIAQVLQQPLGTVLAPFRAFKRLKEMMGVDEEAEIRNQVRYACRFSRIDHRSRDEHIMDQRPVQPEHTSGPRNDFDRDRQFDQRSSGPSERSSTPGLTDQVVAASLEERDHRTLRSPSGGSEPGPWRPSGSHGRVSSSLVAGGWLRAVNGSRTVTPTGLNWSHRIRCRSTSRRWRSLRRRNGAARGAIPPPSMICLPTSPA